MRRALLTVVAVLLMASSARAEGRLAEMDRHLQDLRTAAVSTGSEPTQQQLLRIVEQLGELRRLSDQPPPWLVDETRLRLGEGFLEIARALLGVPCPAGLDEQECTPFRDALVEQAEPMLQQAEVLLLGSEPSKLPEFDRVRLQEAYERLAELRGEPTRLSDPPGLPDEQPLTAEPIRYSLVWADARFATHRNGTGHELRDREWFDGREAHIGEVLLVHVVGAAGQYTEVEVVPAEAWRHCSDDPPVDPAYRVRFFVLPQDLAPVLTTAFEHSWQDGTSVTLRPGVPVGDGKVALQGLVLPLPELPTIQVGLDYLPPERWRGPARDLGPLPLPSNPTVAGRSVSTIGLWPPSAEAWNEDVGLATFASPCGTAVVHSDRAPVAAEPGEIVGVLARMSTRQRAAEGTRLYWPDGSAAGEMAMDRTFTQEQLTGVGFRCFSTPFGRRREGHRQPDLRLCIMEEDLSPVP
jgi:hypothetical protein